MSEYQYYEFVAIDEPLTAKQQGELRAVSTRGRISPSSFVNEYEWGDLKADPRDWMGRYLDDDALEPPVPSGLAKLSRPLRAFVSFLRLDADRSRSPLRPVLPPSGSGRQSRHCRAG